MSFWTKTYGTTSRNNGMGLTRKKIASVGDTTATGPIHSNAGVNHRTASLTHNIVG